MARPHLFACFIAIGLSMAPALPALGQAQPLLSDSALIRYLRRTDHFFSLLAHCRDVKLARAKERVATAHGDTIVQDGFTYTALCQLPREQDSDCLYQVEVSGTLDTPEAAHIRRFRWDLLCGG